MSKLTGLWLLIELVYYQTIVLSILVVLYIFTYMVVHVRSDCVIFFKTVVRNLQQLHLHVAVFLRFLANKYEIKKLVRVLQNVQCAQLRLGWYHCEGWSYAPRWITVLITAYGVNVDAFKPRPVQNAYKQCAVFRLQHKVPPLVPNQHSWQLLLLTISIFLSTLSSIVLKTYRKVKTCLTAWKREAENLSCVLMRFELNAGAKIVGQRRKYRQKYQEDCNISDCL